MGPEEIHIFFWGGRCAPPKENVIDPKTWNFFQSIFKIAFLLLLLLLLFLYLLLLLILLLIFQLYLCFENNFLGEKKQQYMSNICQIFVQYFHNISTYYAQYLHNICQIFKNCSYGQLSSNIQCGNNLSLHTFWEPRNFFVKWYNSHGPLETN